MGGTLSQGYRNELYSMLKDRNAMDRIGVPFIVHIGGYDFRVERTGVSPPKYLVLGLLSNGVAFAAEELTI